MALFLGVLYNESYVKGKLSYIRHNDRYPPILEKYNRVIYSPFPIRGLFNRAAGAAAERPPVPRRFRSRRRIQRSFLPGVHHPTGLCYHGR